MVLVEPNAARAREAVFGLRERGSRLSLSGGRNRRSHPLSGLGVWGLVLGVSASSRRYRCTTTLLTARA
jgi:hypothetical protein